MSDNKDDYIQKILNKHWKYVEIQNFYKNSAANTSVLKMKK